MIETLKTELADLEARRVALRNAHGVRAAATASARDAFIDGDDDALNTVTETHNASEALLYAVNEIDGRIARKRAELADAEMEAERIETFEQRLSIMKRGEDLLAEYIAVRDRANEELKRHAALMSAAFFALQDNRNDWLASIDINANFSFDDFIDAGVDPTAVRAQWDGTLRAVSDNSYVMSHVHPFEDVLRIIFHITYEAKKQSEGSR